MLTARLGRRCANPRSRGFTLVELVAAIVILGAMTAVAIPIFRDLRYDARKAALEGIRMSMVANLNAARVAWTAGAGGTTVIVAGRSISVRDTGYVEGGNAPIPAGSPTGTGMFAMLGCGSSPPPDRTTGRCDGLPGYFVWIADDTYLAVWPDALGATFDMGDASCWTSYWAGYGNSATYPIAAWDQYAGQDYGTDYAYYPKSMFEHGC